MLTAVQQYVIVLVQPITVTRAITRKVVTVVRVRRKTNEITAIFGGGR